ncbi:Aste57867_822 [Aphanomyces stellatus]|uniref:Aste57867_822 protein n=1 Tax=Aphanomyces stellatus TaxID=120398 RepID=A0A485K8L4_9STRA|nr:hypothetical protein As57867_000821 [Aphanomyces stellatus]VFT78046.1 Aste57867_822 [Aphanomyces stellatus]
MPKESPVAMLQKTALEKKLQQRAYIRQFMRTYRGKEKRELEGLKQQVLSLEAELARLVRDRKATEPSEDAATDEASTMALKWKDVALALRDERAAIKSDHSLLHADTNAYHHLVQRMQQWVASYRTIPVALSGTLPSWRNTTLFADERARRLGKAWITQHLYHNAAAVFERHAFPPLASPEEYHDFNIEFAEEGDIAFEYVHSRQFEEHLSYDVVCALYREHMCSMMLADGFGPVETKTEKEVMAETTLHRMETKLAEQINLLCGVFHESSDKCVIVAQQIHDDEAFDHGQSQRHRIWMAEIHRLPNGGTKRRFVHRLSQAFTADGKIVPLNDEAKMWGCDLSLYPVEKREAKYREFCIGYARMMRVNATRRLRDVKDALTRTLVDS